MDAILNWPTFFVSLLWFMAGWVRGYISGRNIGGAGKSNVASSSREDSPRADAVGVSEFIVPPLMSSDLSRDQYRLVSGQRPRSFRGTINGWDVRADYLEAWLVESDPGGRP